MVDEFVGGVVWEPAVLFEFGGTSFGVVTEFLEVVVFDVESGGFQFIDFR
jgi:hypothetical protein